MRYKFAFDFTHQGLKVLGISTDKEPREEVKIIHNEDEIPSDLYDARVIYYILEEKETGKCYVISYVNFRPTSKQLYEKEKLPAWLRN